MADVKCAICGQVNPSSATFCQSCGASLPHGGGSLQAGQSPVPQDTSELDPGLPGWLREARGQAKQQPSNEEEIPSSLQGLRPTPRPNSSDLLAGLHSQSEDDEEEDVPDWLAGVTGMESKKQPQPEANDKRPSVSPSQPAPAQPSDDEVPSWLSNLSAPQEPAANNDFSDWLKQADADDKSFVSPFSSFTEPTPTPEESNADWLSGLQADVSIPEESAQMDTGQFADVDLPEWLKGDAPSAPAPAASTATPDWLKKMDAEASASTPQPPVDEPVSPPEFETPDWLKGMDKSQPPAPAAQPASSADFETPDWLKGMDASAPPADQPVRPVEEFETPDWLKGVGEPQPSAASADFETPDWLKGMEEPAPQSPAAEPAKSDEFETPDWMKGAEEPTPPAAETAAPLDFETPDWLKGMETPAPPASQPAPVNFETPDWLKGMDASEPPAAEAAAPLDFETPDWLKSADAAPAPAAATPDFEMPAWLKGSASAEPPAVSSDFNIDLPDWLKGAGVKSDEPSNAKPPARPAPASPSPAPASAFTDAPLDDLTSNDMPDWLSNLGKPPEPPKPFTTESSIPLQIPDETESALSAEPFPSNELDSLFGSSDMPDWLASVAPAAEHAAEEPDETLSPASLPSWVQAMRPVEAGVGGHSSIPADETLETSGALAGLHGVLPSVPVINAPSKPKPMGIKLQTDDDQQAQAALFEQILAAEEHPEPMVTPARMSSLHILRVVLGVLLMAVVIVGLLMGTQMFSMPTGGSTGAMDAFRIVDQVIPPDAPVLVIFDYEPALAGEMEATAAPLLDHLIVMQHPHLALLSTSPTGAALAEHIFKGPLSQSGGQYVNLGYLPGGLSAVRSFAENPSAAVALPADVSIFNLNPPSVWQSAPWQGIQNLSNFAAVILITDNADTGRTWIEQAASQRGAAQFVVVSSAQAAPMLQPYYSSGQINGLVNGLYDGALLEQNNAGRPSYARHYWDTYNFTLILVLVLLVGGALWGLALNLRERMTHKEGA